MHFIYIIYSKAADRYYVGESENCKVRIHWHNTGKFKGSATSVANDWAIKKVLEVETISEGKLVERYIKSMKSRKVLVKLVSDEMFLNKFKELVKIKFGIKIK